MTQQPLTTAGVQAKQDELYALSDPDLQIQADLIRSDFRNWISTNFVLDASQQTYLNNIDNDWISYNAQATALGISQRLPVLFEKNGSGSLKLVHSDHQINCGWSSNGLTVTGNLAFSISYQ